jgi:hypothetical protein
LMEHFHNNFFFCGTLPSDPPNFIKLLFFLSLNIWEEYLPSDRFY